MLNRDDFNHALSEVTFLWSQEDFAAAIAQLDNIAPRVTPEMKAQCLLFRGMINRDQGAAGDSESDWKNGITFSNEGSYLRYSLQYHLGDLYSAQEKTTEAVRWYRLAVSTCSQGQEFSGTKALAGLLTLNGNQVLPDDEKIVTSAVLKSWRVLGLSGEPDLKDLPSAVRELNSYLSGARQ